MSKNNNNNNRHMKKVFYPLLILLVATLSLTAQKKKETINTPVTVNYCLPKVSFKVIVTLECTKSIPGHYRDQASAKLGLKPAIMTISDEWAIQHIDIQPQYVPDEKAMYGIVASGDYSSVLLSLSPEGFLAGVNAMKSFEAGVPDVMSYQPELMPSEQVIDIIHLNTYNHLKEVLDTNYTFQNVDGVMKKIWDPIERYVAKTTQDNIDEAVKEIFRIRSERVKLLNADNQVPDGKSLAIILKQFNKMEKEYLSLFMGKRERQTVVKVFNCVVEKAGEPTVAFRFSPENGIVSLKNVSVPAYLLQADNVVIPAVTSASAVAQPQTASAIHYRVPAVADLKLMKATEELMSIKAIIPQLGEIKTFPIDIINNESLSLEFYPNYGSLKAVNKK